MQADTSRIHLPGEATQLPIVMISAIKSSEDLGLFPNVQMLLGPVGPNELYVAHGDIYGTGHYYRACLSTRGIRRRVCRLWFRGWCAFPMAFPANGRSWCSASRPKRHRDPLDGRRQLSIRLIRGDEFAGSRRFDRVPMSNPGSSCFSVSFLSCSFC